MTWNILFEQLFLETRFKLTGVDRGGSVTIWGGVDSILCEWLSLSFHAFTALFYVYNYIDAERECKGSHNICAGQKPTGYQQQRNCGQSRKVLREILNVGTICPPSDLFRRFKSTLFDQWWKWYDFYPADNTYRSIFPRVWLATLFNNAPQLWKVCVKTISRMRLVYV